MFNTSHDFWFGLAAMFMAGGLIADCLVTRIGIWNHGLIEANPLYKLLPASVQTFLFKTAFGSFVDGGFRVLLTAGLVVLAQHLGYANDGGAWVPAVIAALSISIAVRNYILIRKLKK